jgi:hypothetical protein
MAEAERLLQQLEQDMELEAIERDMRVRDRLYEQIREILQEIEPDMVDVHIRELQKQHAKLTLEAENRKLIALKKGFIRMRDEQRAARELELEIAHEQRRRRERNCFQNGWNRFCDVTRIPKTWKFKGKRSMRKPSRNHSCKRYSKQK